MKLDHIPVEKHALSSDYLEHNAPQSVHTIIPKDFLQTGKSHMFAQCNLNRRPCIRQSSPTDDPSRERDPQST